ncbi:MAG: 50S ribosomal protein L11 methyltransferase [Betaproteobacteria bacterium]
MAWKAVEFVVDAHLVAGISDALLEEGACSVDVADAEAGTRRESPIFGEPGSETEIAFGLNRVVALFPADGDVCAAVERAAVSSGFAGMPACRITDVEEQDWVRMTQSQFDPIRISDRLWIVPSWHVPPDAAALNITLDPGLAFGTGSHPTTRLCLDWLEERLSPTQSVIDYGCGSGILAIAAGKLGAARVCGIDIDEQAVISSRYNAARNGVTAEFTNAEAPLPPPADIVIANILANPLKVLAPLLARLTLPGGYVVLSGILSAQAAEMVAIYRNWFDMEPATIEQGWVRLTGSRRS